MKNTGVIYFTENHIDQEKMKFYTQNVNWKVHSCDLEGTKCFGLEIKTHSQIIFATKALEAKSFFQRYLEFVDFHS